MGRQYSKDREDEQCLSGETVSVLPDKADKTYEKVRLLPDDEWDFYSGLPNPKWYEKTEENEYIGNRWSGVCRFKPYR
jgi:hypothetical protein